MSNTEIKRYITLGEKIDKARNKKRDHFKNIYDNYKKCLVQHLEDEKQYPEYETTSISQYYNSIGLEVCKSQQGHVTFKTHIRI